MGEAYLAASGLGAALLLWGVIASIRWAARRAEGRLAETMNAASSIVSSALAAADSYQALDGMAEQLAELFDADACVVALPTGDGRLHIGPSHGFPDAGGLLIPQHEGVTGACYQSGEPIIVTDARNDPRFIHQIPGMRYAIAVPLRHRERTLGAFELESARRHYTGHDLKILVPIADQISAALDNMGLRSAAEERASEEAKARSELQAISSIVMAGVASSTDLNGALHSMIQEISARLGWESMAVILYGDDGLLYTRAYYGYPVHSTIIAFHPGQGIVGTVATSGEGRLAPNVSKDPDYLDAVTDTRAEMCQPLIVGGRCLGVLNAESPREGAFTAEDFKLLGMLARQMALVIERTRIADLERDALERLREADRIKDDFLATVSHELRTPLTSIKGYARTMEVRDALLTPEERAQFLGVIGKQCDRVTSIIEMLLLASRLEAGRLEGRATHVEIDELLRDAVEASGVEDRIQFESELGVEVFADRFRIHHIVRNLMENACKYSPPNTPVLVRSELHGQEMRIEVLDQGSGIPEDKEEEIFERFNRLADPGRSAVPGTGLGLYIARRFAHDVGGELTVGRAGEGPWTGARFQLRFPVTPDVDPETVDIVRAGH